MLKIIPLGGLGEIGLNMMVVEYEDHAFIIDAGLMFPEDDMLGIDIVIPDMEYVFQNIEKIAGVVITHAHEDHIGALPYLLKKCDLPIYGTPFTLGVIQRKLEEHGIQDTRLITIHAGQHVDMGPFQIDFIRVSHSTIDGVGLAIHTPVGIVIHTGDFKINLTARDGMLTDVNAFALYGQQGVLALLSDSTNVEKEGYTISDEAVGATLSSLIHASKGRVIVALFASNVARIQQIVDIANATGRHVIFNGRSIEMTVDIARELGFIEMSDGMEVDIREIQHLPDNKVILITTGSQGEPMSALARMASGTHKQIKIRDADTVILSSKFIPGNEKAISNIINDLYRQGADVIYEKIADIHVSGHAFQEELKLMLNLTQPQFFIPIHGEYRHLIHHARLAEHTGIAKDRILVAENGSIICFDKSGGQILDTIATGRILIDGKGVGDVGNSVLKERRSLSEDGLVIVTMVLEEETGVVVYGPEIYSRGFVFWTETGHLVDDAQCVILEIVEEVGPDTPDRLTIIRNRLQKALKQYFNFTIQRRPVIVPIILELKF
ncbi:MAG: ribonuclease J [Deltaproteobacteria bacterium]|nr:MAG: ribonuclease J [Deltaproteobacteria bacterium]